MHQDLKLRNRANAGILSGPRYLSSRLKALGRHKFALAIVLSFAALTPTRAEACSSEWFAVSGILAERIPGDSLARQAYEMRKSRAWADVNACEKRQKDEKRRKMEEERQQQAYLQERQRLDQERTRADIAARTQAVTDAVNRQANADLLATISKAILEGRCEDAKTVALTSSRLDLADQAMRLCTPAAKPPTAAKPGMRNVAPPPVRVNNVSAPLPSAKIAPTPQADLLFAEPTGQGGTLCFYENQRRLSVASGKICPKRY